MSAVSDDVRGGSARLVRARARLERSRARMLDLVGAVSEARRLQRPEPGRWSALEILDHSQLVERSVLRALQSPPPEQPPRLHPALPARVVRALPPQWRLWSLARRFGKAEAPTMVRPHSTLTHAIVVAAAADSRAQTLGFIAATPISWFTAVRRTHPVLGEFDGLEWIEFLAAHEERHLGQLRDALR